MAGMTMNPPEVGMAGVSGSLGFYPFQREASGTAWQPDASARSGLRDHAGAWLLLLRGDIAAGYAQAASGRGGEGGFGSGVFSVTARRDFETLDVIQLRAGVSPDTALNAVFADGRGRQAPRAALEELSAVFSHRIAITDTVFAYAAPVGQPAFGAPLWFDRLSSGGSPVAPVTASRPDALEAAAGVITGGWVHDDWKLDVSSFKGWAPLPDRLTAPGLDSWSARVSVNPAHGWALQASWAGLSRPDPARPAADETRWSVSAIYTGPWGEAGWWSSSALVQHSHLGRDLSGVLLETAASPGGAWTLLARAEQADRLGLIAGPSVQTVRKLSLGAVHDWQAAAHVKIGLGGLYSLGAAPPGLKASLGGNRDGATVFLRLKLG
jgi:hypothetical protein